MPHQLAQQLLHPYRPAVKVGICATASGIISMCRLHGLLRCLRKLMKGADKARQSASPKSKMLGEPQHGCNAGDPRVSSWGGQALRG